MSASISCTGSNEQSVYNICVGTKDNNRDNRSRDRYNTVIPDINTHNNTTTNINTNTNTNTNTNVNINGNMDGMNRNKGKRRNNNKIASIARLDHT